MVFHLPIVLAFFKIDFLVGVGVILIRLKTMLRIFIPETLHFLNEQRTVSSQQPGLRFTNELGTKS